MTARRLTLHPAIPWARAALAVLHAVEAGMYIDEALGSIAWDLTVAEAEDITDHIEVVRRNERLDAGGNP